MNDSIDWDRVARYLDALYEASEGLEGIFVGRKFTLDGHLVGSIGEVVAAYIFDLDLNAASTQAHDAITHDGKKVEIKLTQGRSVAIRHEPEHLIALHRPKGRPLSIVYNGPGSVVWESAGRIQTNGQRSISLARLRNLDRQVRGCDRLPVKRAPPI
jgi:hypothetical protein